MRPNLATSFVIFFRDKARIIGSVSYHMRGATPQPCGVFLFLAGGDEVCASVGAVAVILDPGKKANLFV